LNALSLPFWARQLPLRIYDLEVSLDGKSEAERTTKQEQTTISRNLGCRSSCRVFLYDRQVLGPEGQAVLKKFEYSSAANSLGVKRWRGDHEIISNTKKISNAGRNC
jgi:hypothetical protein